MSERKTLPVRDEKIVPLSSKSGENGANSCDCLVMGRKLPDRTKETPMEGQPRPRLSERQARALEAQFLRVYQKALEHEFRRAMRPDMDHEGAAAIMFARFSKCIRAAMADAEMPKDPEKATKKRAAAEELLTFLEREGMGALRKHQFFYNWLEWITASAFKKFYKKNADEDSPIRVSLEDTKELEADDEAIEDRLDACDHSDRSFLGRCLAPLVKDGSVSGRDADIFLDRLTAWREPGDKPRSNPRRLTLREIGEKHGLKTSQVDRIVRRVLARFDDPDTQERIENHRRDSD